MNGRPAYLYRQMTFSVNFDGLSFPCFPHMWNANLARQGSADNRSHSGGLPVLSHELSLLDRACLRQLSASADNPTPVRRLLGENGLIRPAAC
jgi:hypothetical protein